GGILQRQHTIDDGPHNATGEERDDIALERAHCVDLLRERARTQHGTDDRRAFVQQHAHVELALRARDEAYDDNAAENAYGAEVRAEVIAADEVEDAVDARRAVACAAGGGVTARGAAGGRGPALPASLRFAHCFMRVLRP